VALRWHFYGAFYTTADGLVGPCRFNPANTDVAFGQAAFRVFEPDPKTDDSDRFQSLSSSVRF
jgi:hypothetical protein